MSENLQISKLNVILLLLGVLIAAFLGVIGGNYFIRQRSAAAVKKKLEAALLLKVGQTFPDHNFVPLNTNRVGLYNTLGDKKSILIFLTSECPHCVKLIQKLNVSYPQINPTCQIVGVSYENADKLREFQARENISFPLLNDSIGKFTGKYKIDAYPTLIGLNEKKEIVFVDFGYDTTKNVQDYFKKL